MDLNYKNIMRFINDVEEVLDHKAFDPLLQPRVKGNELIINVPGIDKEQIKIGWDKNIILIKIDDDIVHKHVFADGIRKDDVATEYKAGQLTFSLAPRASKDRGEGIEFTSL